ncbi:MAG: hypothetical protein WBM44_14940 [Waterburya sp.]
MKYLIYLDRWILRFSGRAIADILLNIMNLNEANSSLGVCRT